MIKRITILLFMLIVVVHSAHAGDVLKLDSDWKFRKTGSDTWMNAVVPGTVHTDLLANQRIENPYLKDNANSLGWIDSSDWEYACTFDLSTDFLRNQQAELTFYGLDTYAKVYLNDSLILTADNMFRTWTVSCKKYLRAGKNQLRVNFESALKRENAAAKNLSYTLPGEDRVFSRKAAYQYGWDFAPRFVTCGIWRPVEIKFWSHFTIRDIRVKVKEMSLRRAVLQMNIDVDATDSGSVNIKMINKSTGQRLGKDDSFKKGLSTLSFDYFIYGPKKWWCNGYGEPYVYHLYFELNDLQGSIERKEQNCGIRTIELVRDRDSIGQGFYFKLNDVPIFAKGANLVPTDMFLPFANTTVTDSLVNQAAASNMNMLRVWGGGVYPSDAFYNQCDEKGILVWQDFMFACSMVPGDAAFTENVKAEIRDNVRRLKHHPSLALWCGNNESEEGWGNWGWQKQYKYSSADSSKIRNDYQNLFYKIIPGVIAEEDPDHAYWPSSPSIGWGHPESLLQGDSHYWGVWWGKEPFETYTNKVGRFMSEYGFQAMPSELTLHSMGLKPDWTMDNAILKSHQKHPTGFETIKEYMDREYPIADSPEKFRMYSQLVQADGLQTAIEAHRRNKPRCMGTLFWQYNDCWPSVSWSIKDYSGYNKAAAYMVKDRYKMMILSTVVEGDKLNTYVISDSVNDVPCVVELRLFSFDGREKWFHKEEAVIKGSSSSIVYSIDTAFTKQRIDPAKGYLLVTLISKGVTLDQKIMYFRKPAALELLKGKPEIKLDSSATMLKIRSKVLLKNLYLQINGNDQFSLNYFDVLPNIDYTVGLPPGMVGTNAKIETYSLNDKK